MSNSYGPGDQRYGNIQAPYDTNPYPSYAQSGFSGNPNVLSAGQSNDPYLNQQHRNYPPRHNEANPSYTSFGATTLNGATIKNDEDVVPRPSRTPSPTPSEADTLNRKGIIDWKLIGNWKFWIRREWLWYYLIIVIILVCVALVAIYDKQIVHWLQPTAQKIRDLPGGWAIPIGIFFIISFPPLFGHEILAILVGVVWGLWIGFAITAAGTLLGEIGNFYAFKYCCRSRGEKLEKTKIQYACLARIIREGGFKVALVARLSAIPGHFTTAIFSTCGMNVFVFTLAAILSLPKQFITVYIGVVLEQSGNSTEDTKHKIISDSVFAVTAIVTVLAMWYLLRKMEAVKVDVIYQRRKARQAKLERANYPYSSNSAAESSTFNPRESESESHLPLNPGESSRYQQWDSDGRAVGYVGDPRNNTVHAPSPIRPIRPPADGGDLERGDSALSNPAPFRGAPAMQERQDSAESVSWDTMSGDAYRLPDMSKSRSPALPAALRSRSQSAANSPAPAPGPSQLPLEDPFASQDHIEPFAASQEPVQYNSTASPRSNSRSQSRGRSPAQYPYFPPPPGPPQPSLATPSSHQLDEEDAYGGAHVFEPSDASTSSAYFTAPNPHSRGPTEVLSPVLPSPRVMSPPPPSYRSEHPDNGLR